MKEEGIPSNKEVASQPELVINLNNEYTAKILEKLNNKYITINISSSNPNELEKEVNKLMEAMIEMSNDEFILHEWQKDKMDDLVKQNEMEGAKKQGIMENKIEIAKNMLKENMDIQTISRLTNLTETDIQKIKSTE